MTATAGLPAWAEEARARIAADPTAEPTICGQDGKPITARARCWDDCWGTCLTVAQQAVIDATGELPWPLTHEGMAYARRAAPDAAAQVLAPRVTCAETGERLPLTDACCTECFGTCGRSGGAR
jgi:hypothetical protein